jgi:carbon monoxide dehydrogenase subunit G
MELEHSFTVPVPVDRAWDVLLDVERVAPCMPGATLDSVSGDDIAGRIKVKVGPISMTYAGTAKFTERDKDAGVVVLEASGKDTRGAGTASASVRSTLEGKGDETHVVVHTTLNVTGKPAQFGRGVMTEVGGRLIGIFADNLAKMIAADAGAGSAGAAPGANGVATAESAGSAARQSAAGSGTVASTGESSTGESGGGKSGGSTDPAGSGSAGSGSAGSGTAGSGTAGSGTAGSGTGAQDELLPIDVLNLGTRAWSSLRQAGIQTIGDLVKRTAQQLLAIDNIGPASIADIRRKLADRGLALAESAAGSNGASGQLADTASAAGQAAAAAGSKASAEANGDHGTARQQPSSAEVPTVTPLRAVPSAAPDWQAQDDAIDLLSVAGLPVLKRALPAAVAVLGLILVVLGLRRRRAKRR